MTAQHFMVTAEDAQLDVRDLGVGPLLVLLPGLGRPSSDLDLFASRLVEAGYRVVLPQPRGIGASTGSLQHLTLHDLARDIAAVIETVSGAPAVVIGHAFGTVLPAALPPIALTWCASVVLLSSSGKVQPTADIAEAIRQAQAVDTLPDVRAKAVRDAWFAPGSVIAPWLDGWSQPVMHAYLAAAEATPVEDWWTAGQAEVLIIQGTCDVSAPVGNGRLLREEIGSRATLIELNDVGHALPVEKPDLVADTVIRYLRARNEGGSSQHG